MVVAGVRHLQRFKDMLLKELLAGNARYPFDDVAQENVAGVTVAILAARVEFEWPLAKCLDHFAHRQRQARKALYTPIRGYRGPRNVSIIWSTKRFPTNGNNHWRKESH